MSIDDFLYSIVVCRMSLVDSYFSEDNTYSYTVPILSYVEEADRGNTHPLWNMFKPAIVCIAPEFLRLLNNIEYEC